ncbi:hypothetical protein [Mangrovivirga cuniculi]|uniref:N-acetylglucosamine kinase n=1 Tax=Mangrovivirga cuniculi TaxID=2715131 RepID=A0A4D7JX19_9BACT|nr:hypothetical protein [Mangrovivirga cuniculi]QCK13304.1 hypothetical protein DCC35_00340 [Mangrovivirga cuniculi]
MIYIVDSGGTGADWRFISEKGEISQLRTEGLQANLSSEDDFKKVFSQVKEHAQEVPSEIYFYGAGCQRKEPAAFVESNIRFFGKILIFMFMVMFLPRPEVHVGIIQVFLVSWEPVHLQYISMERK